MPHAQTWDETAPNGATTAASDIDLVIRQLKIAIRERMVDVGLPNFGTEDPVLFHGLSFSNGSFFGLAAGTVWFASPDGITKNLKVDETGEVWVRSDLHVGGYLKGVGVLLTGLANLGGGLYTPPGQISQFQGPLSVEANLALKTGQASILPVVSVTSGLAKTIDFGTGNIQNLTLGHTPVALTFTNPKAGAHYRLELKQDATGTRVVTWPANVYWPNAGTTPAMSATPGRTDVFGLYYNGSDYMAQVIAYGYTVP
jgi:hypothetical protein